MNSDKRVIITRDGEIVKLSIIDLFDDGRISSYGAPYVFANTEEATDEALLNWAKKAVAPEEAWEVELVTLDSFSNDERYEDLKSKIENANTIDSQLADDPSTSKNEAIEE